MSRFLRSIMLVIGFCAVVGNSQSLNGVCMDSIADSVLTVLKTSNDTAITDSAKTLLNTMSVTGTCDSATVVMPISFGPTTVNVMVMSFKKMNNCSLSIKVNPLVSGMMPTVKDTVINVCAITGIRVSGKSGQMHAGRSGVSVRYTGKMLKLNGLVLDMADRLVVRVIDQQGRAVRTYSTAGIATPSWRTDLRHGSFVAVISLNGKAIAANRIDWSK